MEEVFGKVCGVFSAVVSGVTSRLQVGECCGGVAVHGAIGFPPSL